MLFMRKNTLDQLNLNHIGLLELLFASYPITSGYLWGENRLTCKVPCETIQRFCLV